MLFGNQLSASGTGGGVKRARSAALGPRFYDGLAETIRDGFVWKSGIIIRRVLSKSCPTTNIFFIYHMQTVLWGGFFICVI